MEPFLVARNRFADHASRNFALLPSNDLYAPSFQILVDMEEVLHFLQIMLRKVGDVEVLVVVRVVARHRENLVVRFSTIEHLEHTEGTAVDLTSGKGGLVDVHENIQWIPIFVQRTRNESVITRIVDGGIE